MSDSAYPSVPPGHRYPASFSPDGVWWWDGYRWVSTISHDGRWRFNGLAWERLVPRQRLPRWLVITGVGWLTASAAWLVATTVILAVSAPKNPDRTAGITILVLGALGALATVAWGGLVGRRAATRWLWPAAAIGTGVQLFFYVTAMLAAPSNDGGSNDTAAGAGIVILTVPTAALILLLLWLGAAVGALSRMIKGRQPRSTIQCPGDRP